LRVASGRYHHPMRAARVGTRSTLGSDGLSAYTELETFLSSYGQPEKRLGDGVLLKNERVPSVG